MRFILLSFGLAAAAYAQVAGGTLSGTVRDESASPGFSTARARTTTTPIGASQAGIRTSARADQDRALLVATRP